MKNYNLIICSVVAFLFLFSFLIPVHYLEAVPFCHWRFLWGFPCPGCGLSRGFALFFKGHYLDALRMNLLVPLVVLWMSLYACKALYQYCYGKNPNWFSPHGQRWIAKLFIVTLLGQWGWKIYQEVQEGYWGGVLDRLF